MKTIIKHKVKEKYRLNKYISDQGYCSRREADRLIEQGLVYINKVKAVVGMQVNDDDEITINNKPLIIKKARIYIMLNKPKGITTTTDSKIKGNIKDFVNFNELVFPIGRLDKDSSGLILLTNDGDIVNKILREEYGHEKEYIVTVDKIVTDEFLKDMSSGVYIYNPATHKYQKTSESSLYKIDNYTFGIIIKQGLNRQIRRMSEALGYKVIELKRIRIMDIKLDNLEVGHYRFLTEKELISINKRIYKENAK